MTNIAPHIALAVAQNAASANPDPAIAAVGVEQFAADLQAGRAVLAPPPPATGGSPFAPFDGSNYK